MRKNVRFYFKARAQELKQSNNSSFLIPVKIKQQIEYFKKNASDKFEISSWYQEIIHKILRTVSSVSGLTH